jgi:hypothetical protein
VLVRHNTQLLEQAVDLLVKRAAIPTLEAEAAAHEKIARANAFRRMATGAAIAVAAVGIGIGVWLILDKNREVIGDVAITERVDRPERGLPDLDEDPGPPESAPKPVPRPTKPEEEAKVELPAEPPLSPKPPEPKPPEPNSRTIDFTKFVNVDVPFLGSTWQLISGHHFNDENDPVWDRSWCYTRRLVNGVDVNVELVTRVNPTAKPQAPISALETLASVGLNDDLALQLATKCEWLDDAKFASTDFTENPGRPKPQPPNLDELMAQDGWDAIGYDLPNMPLVGRSLEQCHQECSADQQCLALTYDKKNAVCFLKSDASVLIANPGAAMASRRSMEGKLQPSSLQLSSNTVAVGNPYDSAVATYVDCVMSCATDKRCVGLNFDANKLCTLLEQVSSSSPFKGVTSGRKSGLN